MAAVLATGSAFAGMDRESRTSQLEQQMSQVRTETRNNTVGSKTAAGSPQVDGYGVDVSLDVLYWRTNVEGTRYTMSDDGTNVIPWSGQQKNISPSWDWGFRLGVGYNFDHDDWDGQIQYTYFKNTFSSTTASGANDQVTTERAVPWIVSGVTSSPTNYAGTATSKFNLFFNNLDLNLGRHYFVSSDLSLRPFIGVQTSWMWMKQETTYTGNSLSGNITPDDTSLANNAIGVFEKSDFWGIGPEFGMGSRWILGNGFSVFGLLQGALLYGNFDVLYQCWYTPDTTRNWVSINADKHQFAPNARGTLGIRYDKYISNDTQHIMISLGYDAQYWWSMNQMLDFNTQRESDYMDGDLGMQGVTLEIRFDF